MGFNCGIIGLPNVGKSTLFNALTKTSIANAENYPFCTIEPNSSRVPIFDHRLNKLSSLSNSKTMIPNFIEFVDIAGLVKGASKGEGLGNQFLANIREVDAIIHVVRCFENNDITHVHNKIDPINDIDVIKTELVLADLETLEKIEQKLEKKTRSDDKEAKDQLKIIKLIYEKLSQDKNLSLDNLDFKNQITFFKQLNLLSFKPYIYVCNVEENSVQKGNKLSHLVQNKAKEENVSSIIISAEIESEIASLNDIDSKEFMKDYGLDESGLNKVIISGYTILDLITFFTTGPKETRAWTIKKNSTALDASGIIHTDFKKGFIRAETISYDDFVKLGGELAAKEAGKLRIEGSDYLVKDGDIFHFRFNV